MLVTGHTAALVPDPDGILYESRGRRELKNVRDPVELFAAIRIGEASHEPLPRDPVCRMAVEPERAVGRLVYRDRTYFFCTLTCAGHFARHPERFAE